MKLVLLSVLVTTLGYGQGEFLPRNGTAPTRIGTASGPFAGTNILGQFLVGLSTDSLSPVGFPLQHNGTGLVAADTLMVPGIAGNTMVYIQMVAWNRTLWGETFGNVPSGQFGRTDIVAHFLSFSFDPASSPLFTQGAIVPIPEPSTLALAVLGAGALWFATRRRSKSCPPPTRAPE